MDEDTLPEPVRAGRLYLTVSEACAVLGVHRETLYAMIAANAIPHLKHGRTIRIHRAAIENGLVCDSFGGAAAQHRRRAS